MVKEEENVDGKIHVLTFQALISSTHDHDPTSPAQKEVDFFKDHENMSEGQALSQPVAVPVSNGSIAKQREPGESHSLFCSTP